MTLVFEISFCAECSCVLWKQCDAEGFKGYHIVQAGCLKDGLDELEVDGEIFVGTRCKWLKGLEGVKQFVGPDSGLS